MTTLIQGTRSSEGNERRSPQLRTKTTNPELSLHDPLLDNLYVIVGRVGGGVDAEQRRIAGLVLRQIVLERKRQDAKWGGPQNEPMTWVALLTEELGEVARANLDKSPTADLETELVHLAATAVSWLEQIRREREEDRDDS